MHNRYRSDVPSGENVVVDAEADLLSQHGVEVVRHIRSSDEITGMSAASKAVLPARPFYSRQDVAAVTGLLRHRRPDVLHLHNPNPLISMAVVGAAARAGVPVVMTSHNHRHTCVKGSFFRDATACHDCRDSRAPWPAVAHGCYRDSRLQSVVAAGALLAHRSSYAQVDLHIAISSAMRDSLAAAGIAPERIVVKPNSVPDPGPDVAPVPVGGGQRPRFLFIGRIAEEKGVLLLLQAWLRHADGALGELVVVGSGPLQEHVQRVADARSDLVFLGRLDSAQVGREIEASTCVLVPSLWEEPFGLVALEAFARRRPVMSTGLGGLSDVLSADTSWTVPPSVDAWASQLGAVSPAQAQERGAAGRVRYLQRYAPDVVTEQLIGIYEHVVGRGGAVPVSGRPHEV